MRTVGGLLARERVFVLEDNGSTGRIKGRTGTVEAVMEIRPLPGDGKAFLLAITVVEDLASSVFEDWKAEVSTSSQSQCS